MASKAERTPAGFVDGGARIDSLFADPDRAVRVDGILADGHEMDRVHATTLAMIRHAAQLTQQDVAEKLGGRQGDVSRIENRHDLLLSTLQNYLDATGAEDAHIVVTVNGREFALPLSSFADRSREPAERTP